MRNKVKANIIKWLVDFVEKPNPLLNNWAPCPYARQARVNKKIAFVDCTFSNLPLQILENLPQLDTKDVVIFYYDPAESTAEELEAIVEKINRVIMSENYVLLEDHPERRELVNGVVMNFGKAALVLAQRLNKLNDASEQLQAKGYYSHWDEAALNTVVTWRFNN